MFGAPYVSVHDIGCIENTAAEFGCAEEILCLDPQSRVAEDTFFDKAGPARIDRVKLAYDQIADELFAAQRFVVTFLVATPEKAQAIEQHFERDAKRRLASLLRQIPSNSTASVLTDYVVIPGLLTLLPPTSSANKQGK